MKEYIDREALIRQAEKQMVDIKGVTSIAEAIRIHGKQFRRCVETAPAEDVVEVVRCKDCIYRFSPIDCPMCFADPSGIYEGDTIAEDNTYDEAFCSYGKKEE
jgi:hypothetical protein